MEEKENKKQEVRKITTEEKERLFEEALEEIRRDNRLRVRVIAKGFLMTMKVIKNITAFFCILFGAFLTVSIAYQYIRSMPADFQTTVHACLYILGGIFMVIMGASVDSLYYIF